MDMRFTLIATAIFVCTTLPSLSAEYPAKPLTQVEQEQVLADIAYAKTFSARTLGKCDAGNTLVINRRSDGILELITAIAADGYQYHVILRGPNMISYTEERAGKVTIFPNKEELALAARAHAPQFGIAVLQGVFSSDCR